MKTFSVTLDLTRDQLDVLLSSIETILESGSPVGAAGELPRGEKWIDAIQSAPPSGASFDIGQMASVYRKLVRLWPEKNTRVASVMAGERQKAWGERNGTRVPAPEPRSKWVAIGGKVPRDVYVIARASADIDGKTWDDWLSEHITAAAVAACSAYAHDLESGAEIRPSGAN